MAEAFEFESFGSDWLEGIKQEGARITHQCDSCIEVTIPSHLPLENIVRAAICAYASALPRAGGYHISVQCDQLEIKVLASEDTDWSPEDPRSLNPGQEIIALNGPRVPSNGRPSGRIAWVVEIYPGPDGEWWIKARWPGVETDEEIRNNHQLEANGLRVDPNSFFVEGPASKFIW